MDSKHVSDVPTFTFCNHLSYCSRCFAVLQSDDFFRGCHRFSRGLERTSKLCINSNSETRRRFVKTFLIASAGPFLQTCNTDCKPCSKQLCYAKFLIEQRHNVVGLHTAHCCISRITVIAIEYTAIMCFTISLSIINILSFQKVELEPQAKDLLLPFDPFHFATNPSVLEINLVHPAATTCIKPSNKNQPSAATTRNTSHLVVENIWSHSAKPSDCR